MKATEYQERYERREVIDPEAFWLDGEALELIAYPVYTGIVPGEVVGTGYSGDYITAPIEAGTYELWHYVCGGQHSRFEFRKSI